jgi:hypothetical protein
LEENRNTDRPGDVETVMLVGFPMGNFRYSYGTGLFGPLRLDLEIRLIRSLRDSGFRVLYKPHPATASLVSPVIKNYADEIIGGAFETVFQQADTLLFTYTETSTFGFALCTNAAIALLDFGDAEWNARMLELISKRCAVVPIQFDKRNRIDFSRAGLSEAIMRAPGLHDESYVKEFLVPEGRDVA